MKSLNLVFLFTIFTFVKLSAQCPTCIPDYGCGPPEGGVCTSVAPNATIGEYYEEDFSFYMPQVIPVTGQPVSSVDLLEINITGVSGLPPGLTWKCNNHPTCQYFPPSNPPDSEYGCINICGTPFGAPGIYNVTVFIQATVNTGLIGIITENETYELEIEVLPGVGGNQSFSFTPTVNCGPTFVNFESNFPSNGNPNFSYQWDFGNGFQSSSESPSAIEYVQPGIYEISLNTQIDTFNGAIESFTVASSDCDDIFSAPDFYFKLFLGNTLIYESYVIDNQYPPVTFNFAPIVLLRDTMYTIEVWEDDSFLEGSDDYCGTVYFNGSDIGPQTLLDPPLTVQFNINRPIIEYDDVDTLIIYPKADIPVVTNLMGDNTICNKDTIILEADYGNAFQWYKDSLPISGADTSYLKVTTAGSYWVEVFDENGCRGKSLEKNITVNPSPATPSTVFLSSEGQLVASNYNSNFTVQWYFEGQPIPDSDMQFLDVTENGNYGLVYTNSFGCSSVMTEVNVTNVGLEDFSGQLKLDVSVYPNPSDGLFYVEVDIPQSSKLDLSVYNSLGQRMIQKDYITVNNNAVLPLDLSGLENGLYILKLRSGDAYIVHRLIKK
ncbi:MAG: T9SS C-terminal target domain-containing protein [Chitinophagaceae bacterium]|nr:MAG: T9SS C-terminal target domain-containing protein [Chitinophagaceae bacterium]